jgi:hypothetical protein
MLQATGRNHYLEWLVRLLFWIGGIVATVLGSWVASKIHVYHEQRNAHRDDIKKRVLVPIRKGLNAHFRPLLWKLAPMVFVQTGATTHFKDKPKVTEEPAEQGDVLLVEFPATTVFGSLDSALLSDARQVHFRDTLSEVDSFVKRWNSLTGECHVWTSRIANEILQASGLPRFPPPRTQNPLSYVMHLRLGLFVCKRLLGLPTRALYPEPQYPEQDRVNLHSEEGTVAVGSKDEIATLVGCLDGLLDSEAQTGMALRDRIAELQQVFDRLVPKLDYAIASRQLHGRCDLVTFF